MPVNTTIQVRRDTAANWSSTNPTLAEGEVGYDTTNGILKTGNGTTAWNSLPISSNSGMIIPQLPYISGNYYMPVVSGGARTATVNITSYWVFYVQKTTTFDRIACQTSSAWAGTGAVRLGIYNNDPTTMKPSTVLLDAGTVAITAASTTYAITISQTLNAGMYWLASNMQTAGTTNSFFAANTNFNMYNFGSTGVGVYGLCYNQTGVTGAFATAGTLSISSSPAPLPLLRAQ